MSLDSKILIDNLGRELESLDREMSESEKRLDDLQGRLQESTISDSNKGWPAGKIRSTFINFFVEKKGHIFWPSSPVVPVNDPTLLFINAGMNQYKPLFLGTCDPTLEMSKLKMAVNSQKCIRAGGKHNDLEDVGKDVYHHTFFEMLGNWSFGSYFKNEAIPWAWECLTVEFGIDPNRLYATYFGGDESLGLAPDEEARNIWSQFLPANRVLPFGCKDNFWEMGATGPCGPCTEIHYDRIGNRDATAFVNADRPDVIEIWNNVFIQFNRESDGSLKELPAKHVDTGMGFERLASILQGKQSNYDTDIFMPIFDEIARVTNNTSRLYSGKVGPSEDLDLKDMAYRVIADHIRTLTFAITDGAVPSNDGRGYVLRRILRRAVRYGTEMLGAPSGFFSSLVPIVVKQFSSAFPELIARQEFVIQVLRDEELSFIRTLDAGVKHFKKVIAKQLESGEGQKIIPGSEAHFLFSSMGFPLDLTELMAAEQGFTVDRQACEELMEADRMKSKLAAEKKNMLGESNVDLTMEAEQTAALAARGVQPTNTDDKYLWHHITHATIQSIYLGCQQGFGEHVTHETGLVGIILDRTSFYYESGGQIFDTGSIQMTHPDGSVVMFTVLNALVYAGIVVHAGFVTSGELKVGDQVTCHVDYDRRSFIAPNHTMTHVLNYALRLVLKDTAGLCEQKGSLVDDSKTRFDFSWSQGLTVTQIEQIENIVNEQIDQRLPVFTEVIPLAQAASINSVRKVFGETYPDPVRVVSVGRSVPDLLADPLAEQNFSFTTEFCGGTHLSNTTEAEGFVILEESGIAKGIRRIVGVTRNEAAKARQTAKLLESKVSELEALPGTAELVARHKIVKTEVEQCIASVVAKDSLRTRLTRIYENTIKTYLKAAEATKMAVAMTGAESLITQAVAENQEVIIANLDFNADGKVAKKIFEKLRAAVADGSFVLVSSDADGEKVGVYTSVSSKHQGTGISAKAWVDFVMENLGNGRGGGKADMANAMVPLTAGQDVKDVVDRVLTAARTYWQVSSQQ